MKPFAVTDEWVNHHPWEIIQRSMKQLLIHMKVNICYFGLTYIISGGKSLDIGNSRAGTDSMQLLAY